MAAHYDSIILGSGISGLTVATLIAKLRRRKVLILEQHNLIGGFTHTFRRGKYEWDTGLHYVGHMDASDFPRKLMDYVTDGEVEWRRMPEAFELFHFPKFSFAQRAGEKHFRADLIARFPEERAAIDNYFRDLARAQVWGTLRFAARILPPWLGWIPRSLAWFRRGIGETRLREYLQKNIGDADLRALLAGPCGDYGLAPAEASLFIHALIVRHYLEGGFYPKGGSGRIPQACKKHLAKLGVEVLTRHRALEIVVEDGVVRGVRARGPAGEKTFSARQVISCVGARQTYRKLLGGETGREIAQFPAGMTLATIYLGLKESPAKLGFRGENHWLFSSTDFEAMHKAPRAPKGPPQGCYISFPSLKDPGIKAHTAEIMVPACFEGFLQASEGGWKKRGPQYEKLKTELAARVLEYVEKKFPGFGDLVDYVEVSTPLSIDHFTLHARGECYGLPGTPAKFRLRGLGPRTHIRGLYLAGADVFAHGIVGALVSGLCAFTASGSPLDVWRVFRAILNGNGRGSPAAHQVLRFSP